MKAARIEARLTSAALSRRLGKNDQWATQVESGHGSPDPDLLARLARELGRSAAWLITGEDTGRSEFIDSMAAYEPRLDSRAKRMIIDLAEREAAALSEEEREVLDALTRLLHRCVGEANNVEGGCNRFHGKHRACRFPLDGPSGRSIASGHG